MGAQDRRRVCCVHLRKPDERDRLISLLSKALRSTLGKPTKIQLADLLVTQGKCSSRSEAERWILARRVHVDGQLGIKPGTLVRSTAALEVVPLEKYVSRGGQKLERALHEFGMSVAGKVVLDAGASVGGFTDCLLQHGAVLVYAVDAGFGQIRGKLASDPRVVNLERTNISDLRKNYLKSPIDLCVVDLSYLSLVKALPVLAALFNGPPVMIGLIKPLFEGVTPDHKADLTVIRSVLFKIRNELCTRGLSINALTNSPILGTSGTIEFFALVTNKEAATPFGLLVECALARASSLLATGC